MEYRVIKKSFMNSLVFKVSFEEGVGFGKG